MIKTFVTSYDESELKFLIMDCISETLGSFTPSNGEIEFPDKKILTRQETAKLLGISLPTLHSYTKQGLIIAFRLGNKVRYRIEDVFYALKQINVKGGELC